ncbi:uncharacterized, partial [Tachysurus ichikawai]
LRPHCIGGKVQSGEEHQNFRTPFTASNPGPGEQSKTLSGRGTGSLSHQGRLLDHEEHHSRIVRDGKESRKPGKNREGGQKTLRMELWGLEL